MSGENAQPWDTVYERVRLCRKPGCVYRPPLTERDFGGVDFGVPLPPSYRAFALRFGLGGRLGSAFRLLNLRQHGEAVHPSRQVGTVVGDTAFLRAQDHIAHIEQLAGRLICFGCDKNDVRKARHVYAWTTREGRDWRRAEYAVFQIRLICVPGAETKPARTWVRVAENFHEFVEWTQHRGAEETVAKEPLPILYWPLVMGHRHKPRTQEVARWLAFNNYAARDLARSIRDEKHTDAFPVLADALEEAGCTNADLLDSCRTGDPDIDGAWVLRVLLGG